MLVYNRNSQHGSINIYSRWKMLVRLSCLPRGTWQAYRWLRFSPSQWSGYHRLPGLDLGLQSYLRWTWTLYCFTSYPTIVPLGLVAGGQVQTLLDVGVAGLVVSDGVEIVILPNNVSVGPRELTILLGL